MKKLFMLSLLYCLSGNLAFAQLQTCTDIYESNNTAATATPLSFSGGQAIRNAKIAPSGDNDYFGFLSTSNNPCVKISLDMLPLDYDLQLLMFNNSTGTWPVVATSTSTGTTAESITYNNTASGSYKVRVYPKSSSQHTDVYCYRLLVSLNSQCLAPRYAASPVIHAATNVKVFPNPASEKINIQVVSENYKDQALSLQVFDLSGKNVLSLQNRLEMEESLHEVSVSKLASGIYTFRVSIGEAVFHEKVTIQ